MTVQQVRRLVKIMDDVLKGNPKLEDKDKKALDEARELSERTISKLAVDWHNEGKKTRDEATFEFANAVYADYLTLFPQSPQGVRPALLLGRAPQRQPEQVREGRRRVHHGLRHRHREAQEGRRREGEQARQVDEQRVLQRDPRVDRGGEGGRGGGEDQARGDHRPEQEAHHSALEAEPARRLQQLPEVHREGREEGRDRLQGRPHLLRLQPPRRGGRRGCPRSPSSTPTTSSKTARRPAKSPPTWCSTRTTSSATGRRSTTGRGSSTPRRSWPRASSAIDLAKLIEQSTFKLINQLEAKKDYAEGRRGLHDLRDRVAEVRAGRQGVPQRRHRLLQREDDQQGDRAAQAVHREVPEVAVRARRRVRAGRRVRGDRRLRTRRRLLRVLRQQLREEHQGQEGRPSASAKEGRQGQEGRARAGLGRAEGAGRALQRRRLPRGPGHLQARLEEPREVPGPVAQVEGRRGGREVDPRSLREDGRLGEGHQGPRGVRAQVHQGPEQGPHRRGPHRHHLRREAEERQGGARRLQAHPDYYEKLGKKQRESARDHRPRRAWPAPPSSTTKTTGRSTTR